MSSVLEQKNASDIENNGIFTPERTVVMSEKNKTVQHIEIQEIAISDIGLVKNVFLQSIPSTYANGSMYMQDGNINIRPHSSSPYYATLAVDSKQLIKMIDKIRFSSLTKVDINNPELPSIGQRFTTPIRIENILRGWRNTGMVPEGKIEVIHTSMFGAKIRSSKGGSELSIELTDNSRFTITDGLGRLSSVIKEYNEIIDAGGDPEKDHVCISRKLQFLFVINLSGDVTQAINEFLLYNRDAKKSSAATNAFAELAKITRYGEDYVPENIYCKEAATWLMKKVYDFDLKGTMLEYMPWSFEGHKQKSSLKKRGSISTLQTVFSSPEYKSLVKSQKLRMKDIPEILRFIIEQWSIMIPGTIDELSGNKPERRNDKGTPIAKRSLSNLYIKLVFGVGMRVYNNVGKNAEEFRRDVQSIMGLHFKNHKSNYPTANMKKKMTTEDFLYYNSWFCAEGFNSGAANTKFIIDEFKMICDSFYSKK